MAYTLAHEEVKYMNQCEIYGMAHGCDTECPVLRAGKCELQNSDNAHLWEEILNEVAVGGGS